MLLVTLRLTVYVTAASRLIAVRPMRAFIVIASLLAAKLTADAATPLRADVYFRGWSSERYAAISPEGLRREAHQGFSRAAHITAPAELQRLLAVLDLSHFRATRGDPRRDTYLVVDLFYTPGGRTTYRSDGFHLWTADCTRGRALDAHFRKFFEQFTPRSDQAMQRSPPRRSPHTSHD
jgi:hypothetical protein